MKEECIRRLERCLRICVNMDGFHRFSGMVHMAYYLELITEEEKENWLDKAAERVHSRVY